MWLLKTFNVQLAIETYQHFEEQVRSRINDRGNSVVLLRFFQERPIQRYRMIFIFKYEQLFLYFCIILYYLKTKRQKNSPGYLIFCTIYFINYNVIYVKYFAIIIL